MDKARILIVDDHPIVLLGLKIALADSPDFVICGEADSVSSTYEEIHRLKPSIIVLDLLLGANDGMNLIRTITEIDPDTRILVYSCQAEQMAGPRAQRAGAHGYVSKIDGLSRISEALEAVSRGDLFFHGKAQRRGDAMARRGERRSLHALSKREMQVLRLTGQGLSLQRMARELALSTKTIGTYRERLKIKLGVDRVQELVWMSQDLMAQNLIDEEPRG